jgi:hypothetical protein
MAEDYVSLYRALASPRAAVHEPAVLRSGAQESLARS